MKKNFGKYRFTYICAIQPERDKKGKIRQFTPQCLYMNRRRLPLHKYGKGPFCRFRIPKDFPIEGVYTLIVNGIVKYIGECINLSSRFNMGYGQISPRNCYYGGQHTNCRVNHLILETTKRSKSVGLWFFKTPKRKNIESELIADFHPFWNR